MPKFVSQIDTSKIPVKGLVPESASSQPSGSVPGQFWFDTSVNKVKFTNDGTNYKDPLDRANHTGTQLANTISDFTAAVTAFRLDQFAVPTAPINLGGQRATNGSDPSAATDLATKQYVDNARAGISGVKDPVMVAVGSNVNLSAPGASLDGVALSNGDRFLPYAQTTGTQNGIYIYNGAAVAATRAPDADAAGEIVDGTVVAVAQGTNAGAQFIQTATPSGAPGSWTQTWVKYTVGAQTYTADGSGIELSGTTFSLELDGTSLSKGPNGLKLNLADVTQGGTGATTAAGAKTNLGFMTRYAANLGAVTAGTPVTVNHGLNSTDVTVTVREVTGGAVVIPDVIVVDANNVSITSAVAYSSGALRVVVIG